MKHKHHFHRWQVRALYALALSFFVMVLGTAGMKILEKISWIDAFYFMTMIATSQGSAITPATVGGKIFASFMAFVSAGFVLAALSFFIGPLMGRLFKVGFEKYDPAKHVTQNFIFIPSVN